MKRTFVYALATLGVALLMSACKNNDGGSASVSPYGVCQAGYIQTQYGCLPQSSCPVGQAMYNNTCIPGTVGGQYPGGQMCQAGYLQTQYGCLPQGSCQAGQAMYNNTCIPGTVGGQYPGGQYPGQYGNQYLGGQYPNGYPYGSYPYGSTYYQYPYGSSYGNTGYYWYWYGL